MQHEHLLKKFTIGKILKTFITKFILRKVYYTKAIYDMEFHGSMARCIQVGDKSQNHEGILSIQGTEVR